MKVFFLICFLVTGTLLQAQPVVSFQSELFRLKDVADLPAYRQGTIVKQVSSYDTTGGNDDGFGGKYSFLRKDPDGGLVIFDARGPGVIERIWTPTPTDDTLDFYFDGNDRPGLSIRFRDLFSGRVYPFLAPLADHKVGGFYSYIPIPFSKSCKIVFRGEKILFHQIQYRSFEQGVPVTSYSSAAARAQQALLEQTARLWKSGERSVDRFYKSSPPCIRKDLKLEPGNTISLAEMDGGGRIVGIELLPAAAFEGLNKLIDLKITWDNEKRPAILVPVADFFGFAYGSRSMESLLLGTTSAKAYCYLPMPFDKAAKIELVYRSGISGSDPVNLQTRVYYTRQKRNPKTEGRFYSYWKQEDPEIGQPYIFMNASGQGHYVGTLMQGQATDFTHFTEFFEGDDYTAIDGVPTVHGTGSEDYFNGGWYAQPGGWVERLGAPLSGCLDYSLPLGRTGGYRFFLSDKMPFSKSILHSIEHGPVDNNRQVRYISVAMYYADRNLTTGQTPGNATTEVYQPDTVTFYTRLMQHLTYNGHLGIKDNAAQLDGAGDAQMNINVTELEKGQYKIYLSQIKSNLDQLETMITSGGSDRQWQTLEVANGERQRNLYIGTLNIYDPAIPVSILFKTTTANPLLRFDRVSLVKVKK
ncbi:hypothetical protein GCM10027051_26530 [Niabella terrae]